MPNGKVALFAYNGEEMCFVHVLLQAIDYQERGWEPRIVVEGTATRLIPQMNEEGHRLNGLFKKAKERDLFDGACRACSTMLGVAEDVQKSGLRLLAEMNGHPSIAWYREMGYEVITF